MRRPATETACDGEEEPERSQSSEVSSKSEVDIVDSKAIRGRAVPKAVSQCGHSIVDKGSHFTAVLGFRHGLDVKIDYALDGFVPCFSLLT